VAGLDPVQGRVALDTITYLQHQLTNINVIFHDIVAAFRPEELLTRPAPGQNMIGYAVWHIPRTQDAHVHTWIRGVPEIAHQERWRHLGDHRRFGYGVGISLDEADEVARSTKLPDILDYADEVQERIMLWLQGLSQSDLDHVPDVARNLAKHLEYQTPGYLREVEHLFARPAWDHLMRPCIGHVHRHLGELEILRAVIRSG
jgi:hypothetical protein